MGKSKVEGGGISGEGKKKERGKRPHNTFNLRGRGQKAERKGFFTGEGDLPPLPRRRGSVPGGRLKEGGFLPLGKGIRALYPTRGG